MHWRRNRTRQTKPVAETDKEQYDTQMQNDVGKTFPEALETKPDVKHKRTIRSKTRPISSLRTAVARLRKRESRQNKT